MYMKRGDTFVTFLEGVFEGHFLDNFWINNSYYLTVQNRCAYRTTADGDSADMLPVEDTVGETTTTRPFGSIYPIMRVSRWQLNQSAKKNSDLSDGELNNQ